MVPGRRDPLLCALLSASRLTRATRRNVGWDRAGFATSGEGFRPPSLTSLGRPFNRWVDACAFDRRQVPEPLISFGQSEPVFPIAWGGEDYPWQVNPLRTPSLDTFDPMVAVSGFTDARASVKDEAASSAQSSVDWNDGRALISDPRSCTTCLVLCTSMISSIANAVNIVKT